MLCGDVQTYFLQNIYTLLGDKDGKVRLAASGSLCQYVRRQAVLVDTTGSINRTTFTILQNFVSERIFKELPDPLSEINVTINNTTNFDKVLGKVLYNLTNKLLELNDKNQQVRVYLLYVIVYLTIHLLCMMFKSIWM